MISEQELEALSFPGAPKIVSAVLDGEIDHRDHVLTIQEKNSLDRMMTCCSRAKGHEIVLAM